jgi:hypothetical protein
MATILITTLFTITAIAVMIGLSDSLVRGRNAWRAIRREMALDMTRDIPANDAVVVQMRRPATYAATQKPLAAAA